MRSQSPRSLEDLTPSFPKHKKGGRPVLPSPHANTGLAHSRHSGLTALGPLGWKTPKLHLPSLQSSWRVGTPGAAVRVQEPLPGWEPGAEGPSTRPAAQKCSLPPPLSHLQGGDRRDSGPDNSSFFAQALRQGTTPACPLGIPQERGLWACFPVCVLACSCFCHF